MDRSRLRTTRTIANLKAGRNDWYRIKAQAGAPTSVMVYDEIGWFGITAQDFINDLKQVQGPIDLHLNSPGGEVFDGIAIHAFLAARGGVTTYVDSLAASIASVIAMAGDEIVMGRNASMMIHDGWGMCIGNAADMLEQADLLSRVSDNIASIYADRTGKPVEHWREAMLAETWYIGKEAVDAGLADRLAPANGSATNGQTVVPGVQEQEEDLSPAMAATFDLSVFRRTPAALRNHVEPAAVEPAAPDPVPDSPPIPDPPIPDAEPEPEAPADTDRGFVVPVPEEVAAVETEPAVEPAPEPAAALESQPAAPAAETQPLLIGEEILAQLRAELKALSEPKRVPLGMESMPLLDKAIAVHHTDTVDTAWDGPAAVAVMPAEYADLHYCHAWQSAEADASSHTEGDDDADDKKSSFKFPHHAKKGGPANLAACRNGLARLSGADIPDADRAGVKAHLQAHLDDADSGDDTQNHTHENPTFAWDPTAFLETFGRGSKR